jgi:hypothetical protein
MTESEYVAVEKFESHSSLHKTTNCHATMSISCPILALLLTMNLDIASCIFGYVLSDVEELRTKEPTNLVQLDITSPKATHSKQLKHALNASCQPLS